MRCKPRLCLVTGGEGQNEKEAPTFGRPPQALTYPPHGPWATDTELAYTPVTQAYSHSHRSQFIVLPPTRGGGGAQLQRHPPTHRPTITQENMRGEMAPGI